MLRLGAQEGPCACEVRERRAATYSRTIPNLIADGETEAVAAAIRLGNCETASDGDGSDGRPNWHPASVATRPTAPSHLATPVSRQAPARASPSGMPRRPAITSSLQIVPVK